MERLRRIPVRNQRRRLSVVEGMGVKTVGEKRLGLVL
jgi:hypothetical protein